MNKKWEYYEPNEEKIKEISEKNNISKLLAKILVNREITEEKQIETFLNPTRNDFYDPFLMPDMEKAVESTGKTIDVLDKEDKVAIVKYLDEKGAFLIKKSAERVAEYLDISRFTVYNYLNETKEE